MLKTCATCRYSRPALSSDGFPLTEEEARERPHLFCQASPPIAMPGSVDCWPAVSAGEVCGEWCGDGDAGDALDSDEASLEATLDFLAEEIIAIRTTLDALTATLRPTSIVLRPDTP